MAVPRLFRVGSQWIALVATALLGLAVLGFVDLEPKVDDDFFFASDDPQIRGERELRRKFGEAPAILIAVRSEAVLTRPYLERIEAFTAALLEIPGVAAARSLTRGPLGSGEADDGDGALDVEALTEELEQSAFWPRLLLARDGGGSFVLLRLDDEPEDRAATISAIDRVAARFDARGFDVGVSGVPYVAEHIRRQLGRDLRVFSVAALIAFALLIALLFRSLAVLVGALLAALAAGFATFLARAALGMETGLLTPNLWTIAFVLTISHVVYLTARYLRTAREEGENRALRSAVQLTGPASLWSLAANLLGFASLLLAPAKPLREFGASGAIAAVAALAAAYGLFPLFLRSARAPGEPGPASRALERFFTRRHPWLAAGVTLAALALAPFAPRVDTDPPLPAYFAEGGAIRSGLEKVDRSGGTSPLDLVVRDAGGGALGDDDSFARLMALQEDLEEDPAVGVVLTPALLMAETERPWWSFLVPWEKRLDALEKPKLGRIGRTFFSEDHRQGRILIFLHERERQATRGQVIARLADRVRAHGFDLVLVGGLFELQGEISELVRASVVRGLGGLLASFFVITWITARSLRTAAAMTLCLALVPLGLFGAVALAGMPLDIISAPAANVALPMGIDEMIHLGYAVRRSRKDGKHDREARWRAWKQGLAETWQPILYSALTVGAGFSLFLLSRFPPTHRLGALASAGAVLTDLVVLLALPALATWAWRRRASS
jgi:predicted RND superfamily exporter protein